MYYTVQNQLLCEFKCLCLTNSPPVACGLSSIKENISVCQDTIIEESFSTTLRKSETVHHISSDEVTCAYDIVLRRCGQTEPLPFQECYPNSILQNCFKIGEGVYGEVFLFRNKDGGSSVMKVIPIEGNQLVNGEHQKQFNEILSEIVISMELSDLRKNPVNMTGGFNEVKRVRCVTGRYPPRLLELWELYQESHGSENDSPEMFGDDQLYIILELANGGKDMEAFVFKNAVQAISLFKQVSFALAVAESALEFEHRDLHWGNVLVAQSDEKRVFTYYLDGKEYRIASCGIEASIIDFTLSRIKFDNVIMYNDISSDPDLFTATGDYQFEIYKLMQSQNGNDWEHYEPFTNVLWLHYILDKMVTLLNYSHRKSKTHRDALLTLHKFKSEILKYRSVNELVANEFIP